MLGLSAASKLFRMRLRFKNLRLQLQSAIVYEYITLYSNSWRLSEEGQWYDILTTVRFTDQLWWLKASKSFQALQYFL